MSKNNPLVSIIVTCYNYGGYVQQAVESVWSQTYSNIELIVINDGSTDNSDDVISGLLEKKDFNYINQKNQGIIATRNLGMSIASGDYVMQLDADDWLDKTYVDKCLTAAKKSDAQIVYTQVHIFGRADFVSNYIDFDLEKLKHDNFIHATALVNKKILGDNPYDPYLNDKGYEDWDMFLDLCLNGASAKLVDEPLLHYRKHSDRKSRSDDFASAYKEMLVRHHIWSKQNEKHPEQFWYFSSQIETLFSMIRIYQENGRLTQENSSLNNRIRVLEHRDFVTLAKKAKGRIVK